MKKRGIKKTMCGINGFISYDNKTENQLKKIATAMNNSMKHRGPDDQTSKVYENIGLGHVRLSIIDLSDSGNQPMKYNNGNYIIVFNGEIYNYQELKKELLAKGHYFQSKTDTEVILAGYKEWKEEVIEKLNGMFAFAIYDRQEKKIILARDRLGIKPIYCYYDENQFMFSSEIKGLLTLGVRKEINLESLKEYLQFQNTFGEKTFFKNINLIEPGTYLVINTKDKSIHKKKYWDITFKKENNTTTFRETFEKSIERQLMSDVAVGTYLSGGFDSTSVTMLATKHNKNMHTFTAAFEEGKEYDERTYSREVAKKIDADLHEIIITPKMFKEVLPKVIHHLDEPTKLGRSFAQYYVAKKAREHVTVALTGHGGDELFAGYPIFLAKKYALELKKKPWKILSVLYQISKHSSKKNIIYYLFGPLIKKDLKYDLISLFSEQEINKLSNDDYKEELEATNNKKWLNKLRRKHAKDDSLQSVMRLYLKTFLPTLFLVEDRMSMAHSIESRVPICDNELIDFALKQSFEEKLFDNELKWTIKEGMRDILPKSLYSASKKGFPVPLRKWFNEGLKEYLYDKLLSEKSKIKSLFNQKEIKKLIDRNANFIDEQKIWMLLNIEIWMEEHF